MPHADQLHAEPNARSFRWHSGAGTSLFSGQRARALAEGVRARIDSVDLLRGLVMALMALDHTRDFFGASSMNPRDVAEPALFLTRWVTHFCGPTFVLLAGVSAYLYGARVKDTASLGRFLLTRGLWLILIEFTVVRLGWTFTLGLDYFLMQVIWAIGVSMVVLAGLVHLPRRAIAAFALATIAGHNLLDGIHAKDFAVGGWVWNILHEPAMLVSGGGTRLFALYPLIPWIGVMAAGYALGPVLLLEPAARVRRLVRIGLAVTAGFVLLRATNLYGDPSAWAPQGTWLATALSFINCEKYPPSLLYLMMTLGPALLMLAAFERARGRLADWITTFGRAPFLYYVAHIFLIHAMAVVVAGLYFGDGSWLFGPFPQEKPDGYGLPLAGVYAMWLAALLALYPLCRWYASFKQRRREWWWSYV